MAGIAVGRSSRERTGPPCGGESGSVWGRAAPELLAQTGQASAQEPAENSVGKEELE